MIKKLKYKLSLTNAMAKIKMLVEGYRCERCEHEWMPRSKSEEEPRVCPKCKSPYWDRPKTDRSEVARKAWETRRKQNKV